MSATYATVIVSWYRSGFSRCVAYVRIERRTRPSATAKSPCCRYRYAARTWAACPNSCSGSSQDSRARRKSSSFMTSPSVDDQLPHQGPRRRCPSVHLSSEVSPLRREFFPQRNAAQRLRVSCRESYSCTPQATLGPSKGDALCVPPFARARSQSISAVLSLSVFHTAMYQDTMVPMFLQKN